MKWRITMTGRTVACREILIDADTEQEAEGKAQAGEYEEIEREYYDSVDYWDVVEIEQADDDEQ